MKTKVLLIILVVAAVVACKKDKLDTVPKIKVKSLNTTEVPVNGTLRVTLEFADKEGDLQDTIFVKKIRLNKNAVPTIRDSFPLQMPDFPANTRGEITLDLNYQAILSAINPPTIPGSNPPQKEPDTLILKFSIRDLAKHLSDTATSSQLRVIR
ncbi:MAG: hypothetical protein HYX40_01010 [Sphingobacteriales bacterium]|nr:hypothetical protein [Sphingobacteriales bacterium]